MKNIDNKIDKFLKETPKEMGEVTFRAINVPNSPNCMPEVLSLMKQYGIQYETAMSNIRQLRSETGLPYESLQAELQKRFFENFMIEGCLNVARANYATR